MGQIFEACAFDVENKKCCKLDILTYKRGPTYYLKPSKEGKNTLFAPIKA